VLYLLQPHLSLLGNSMKRDERIFDGLGFTVYSLPGCTSMSQLRMALSHLGVHAPGLPEPSCVQWRSPIVCG
jgi:hypothetical protein